MSLKWKGSHWSAPELSHNGSILAEEGRKKGREHNKSMPFPWFLLSFAAEQKGRVNNRSMPFPWFLLSLAISMGLQPERRTVAFFIISPCFIQIDSKERCMVVDRSHFCALGSESHLYLWLPRPDNPIKSAHLKLVARYGSMGLKPHHRIKLAGSSGGQLGAIFCAPSLSKEPRVGI